MSVPGIQERSNRPLAQVTRTATREYRRTCGGAAGRPQHRPPTPQGLLYPSVRSILGPGRNRILHLLGSLLGGDLALKQIALDGEVLVGYLLRERLVLDGVERLLPRALRPLIAQRRRLRIRLCACDR